MFIILLINEADHALVSGSFLGTATAEKRQLDCRTPRKAQHAAPLQWEFSDSGGGGVVGGFGFGLEVGGYAVDDLV